MSYYCHSYLYFLLLNCGTSALSFVISCTSTFCLHEAQWQDAFYVDPLFDNQLKWWWWVAVYLSWNKLFTLMKCDFMKETLLILSRTGPGYQGWMGGIWGFFFSFIFFPPKPFWIHQLLPRALLKPCQLRVIALPKEKINVCILKSGHEKV